jgi:hypothetical protein
MMTCRAVIVVAKEIVFLLSTNEVIPCKETAFYVKFALELMIMMFFIMQLNLNQIILFFSMNLFLYQYIS